MPTGEVCTRRLEVATASARPTKLADSTRTESACQDAEPCTYSQPSAMRCRAGSQVPGVERFLKTWDWQRHYASRILFGLQRPAICLRQDLSPPSQSVTLRHSRN